MLAIPFFLNGKQLLISVNVLEDAIVIWEIKKAVMVTDFANAHEFVELKKAIIETH